MKTLEQVQEHFKEAKTIYCLAEGSEFNVKNADNRGIHFDMNSYWLVDAKTGESYLICNSLGNFAKIKTEIIKTKIMKTAIAMKCTQEQFDAVKGKLVGCKIGNITSFFEHYYLVNNNCGEQNLINNIPIPNRFSRKIHETWNEQIFLEACGIEPEKIFKGSELQYWDEILDKWKDCFGNKYRLKPNNTSEIEALEQQKLEIDKQIEKLR